MGYMEPTAKAERDDAVPVPDLHCTWLQQKGETALEPSQLIPQEKGRCGSTTAENIVVSRGGEDPGVGSRHKSRHSSSNKEEVHGDNKQSSQIELK